MTPTIEAPKAPDPLPPVQSPTGTRPKQKSATPSFMGSAATPSMGNATSGKTLLGQ